MKTNKKQVISLLLATVISCASLAACGEYTVQDTQEIKNVILIIGDGMGENHVDNAVTYFELDQPDFFENRVGNLATHSLDNDVTDSAAAASALATGNKVNNGEISRHDGKDLTSVSQLALLAGKKVGVVTTDTLDGATPAAFSSHANNRSDCYEIISGQASSGIHLLMGESSSEYTTRFTMFEDTGYTALNSFRNLKDYMQSEKLIVTLPNIRSEYAPMCSDHVQLKDMAAFAIDYLDNENGYFLMIEGAYIDKYSHSNLLNEAMCEVRSLFDTIEYLYNTVGDDTAIIVTADHETGKLEKAATMSEMNDNLYHSGNHSSSDVPLYAYNFSLNIHKNKAIENTEIFNICKKLLNIK